MRIDKKLQTNRCDKTLYMHESCTVMLFLHETLIDPKILVSGTFQFYFILHLILVFPHKPLESAHLVCPFRAPVHMRREHNAAAYRRSAASFFQSTSSCKYLNVWERRCCRHQATKHMFDGAWIVTRHPDNQWHGGESCSGRVRQ